MKFDIKKPKAGEFLKSISEKSVFFDFIGGATMDGSRSQKKDVIRYVLDALQIEDLSKVLMIGDRKQDVEGAAANQIACAGVLYGYGDYEELKTAGADRIIERPEDLSQL